MGLDFIADHLKLENTILSENLYFNFEDLPSLPVNALLQNIEKKEEKEEEKKSGEIPIPCESFDVCFMT